MAKVFTSIVELQAGIEKACNIAVEQTALTMMEKLKEIINEQYYDLYAPTSYDRTRKFLESATYKMLSGQPAAIIGIDESYFSYQYPAKYTSQASNENLANIGQSYSGHWTGEDQVYMADAGYHGNAGIYRDGHFWKEFEEWATNNATTLLRDNLRKQGLNVK